MAKYHINSKGIASICRATKGNCPFGGSENHYGSKEEAAAAAEKDNKESYSLLPEVKENPMSGVSIRKEFPHLNDKQVETFEQYTQLELDVYDSVTKLQNREDKSSDSYYDAVQESRELALKKYAKHKEVNSFVDKDKIDEFITPHLPDKPVFARPASYHAKIDISEDNIDEGIGPVMTSYSGKSIDTIKSEIGKMKEENGGSYHENAVKYWNNLEQRKDKPIISIDLETANPMEKSGNYDNGQLTYIIEVGAVKTYPDGRVEKKNILYDIPKEFSDRNGTGFENVHKITKEDIEGKPKFTDKKQQKEMLNFMKDSVYIAHNAEFEDKQFTHSLRGYKGLVDNGDIEILDTAKFSKYLIHDTEGNSNIHMVTKAGIEYKDAHRALNDAEMTLGAFTKLKNNR